ncbi:MAG: cytochrome c peroxidase [Gammaproteobacteria bacterium]|nr:cytochrome c peroxidase [Gammaproteobacteria bacterium]
MKRLLQFLVLTTSLAVGILEAHERSSSIVVFDGDTKIAVANQDSSTISIVDFRKSSEKITEIPVGSRPQSIGFDNTTKTLIVVNQNEDALTFIDSESYSIIGQKKTGRGPFGVVTDSSKFYVSNQLDNSVDVFDTSTFIKLATIGVDAEPRGLALSKGSRWLYVTHFKNGRVSVIDTTNNEVVSTIDLGSKASLSQSIALSEDGKTAFLPQTFVNDANRNLQFDTTVFPSLSIVDLERKVNLRNKRLGLDIVDEPVGIPIEAIAFNDTLYILNAASNDLSILDLNTFSGSGHIELGSHPLGITLNSTGTKLYVDNSLDGTITVIDTQRKKITQVIEVTNIPLEPDLLAGKRLFNSSNDTRLSKDQWIACATCHFDGGADLANWFFPDGKRNTPSLYAAGKTPPFHWAGNLDEIQDVEETIRNIQGGSGLAIGDHGCDPACDQAQPNKGRSADLDRLSAYVESLLFPSNFDNSKKLNSSSDPLLGQQLFFDEKVGCSACHAPPLYQDGKQHSVNLSLQRNRLAINTPSLLGLSQSPPYLHDGSAESIEDVVNLASIDDSHGEVSHLSQHEINSLIDFTMTIDISELLAQPRHYSALQAPAKRTPHTKNVFTKFEIDLNQSDAHVELDVKISESANVPIDIYLAIELVGGQFAAFIDSSGIMESGTKTTPFATHTDSHDLLTQNVLSLKLNKSDLTAGKYLLHSVSVNTGTSIFARALWLDHSTAEFTIDL